MWRIVVDAECNYNNCATTEHIGDLNGYADVYGAFRESRRIRQLLGDGAVDESDPFRREQADISTRRQARRPVVQPDHPPAEAVGNSGTQSNIGLSISDAHMR